MFPPARLSASLFCLSYLTAFISANPLPDNTLPSLNSYVVVPDNGSGTWPYREYKSSNITPPVFRIKQNGGYLAPGLVFVDVADVLTTGENQLGPMIFTSSGDLIWAGPDVEASNVRTQKLYGKTVMSYWRGSGAAATGASAGHGYGVVDILDDQYKLLHTVSPKINITLPPTINATGYADVHESYITHNNTMLMTVYNFTTADLTSVGGPKNGWVQDPLAIEVDIETNEVLWVWSPVAHVPISATHSVLGNSGRNLSSPFDWFHTNSIQPYEDRILINSRHTWTSYYVNRDGSIEWEINGLDGGDFGSLPPGGSYSWQHHARLHDTSTPGTKLLTYFANDNSAPTTHNISQAIGLLVDFPPNKSNPPKLWARLNDPTDPLVIYAEGSHQLLFPPNTTNKANDAALAASNHFVGYGIHPVIKEYGPLKSNGSADVRWSAQFGYVNGTNGGQSYRAFKEHWCATPSTPVAFVVLPAAQDDGLSQYASNGTLRGYVSWNGATDVDGYAVYTSDGRNVHRAGVVMKKGFETEFVIPNLVKTVQVKAIRRGREVGQSAVVTIG